VSQSSAVKSSRDRSGKRVRSEELGELLPPKRSKAVKKNHVTEPDSVGWAKVSDHNDYKWQEPELQRWMKRKAQLASDQPSEVADSQEEEFNAIEGSFSAQRTDSGTSRPVSARSSVIINTPLPYIKDSSARSSVIMTTPLRITRESSARASVVKDTPLKKEGSNRVQKDAVRHAGRKDVDRRELSVSRRSRAVSQASVTSSASRTSRQLDLTANWIQPLTLRSGFDNFLLFIVGTCHSGDRYGKCLHSYYMFVFSSCLDIPDA
jgi:hypothetical protein